MHATLATQSPKQGSRRSRENQDIYTNLTQELDNGIIVICQVKTVGYDADKYTGNWQVVVAHRIAVLQAKNQTL